MGNLPHGIGHYLKTFDDASKRSPQEGAEVFVEYVKNQQDAGGFEATEAFNICVQNIKYGLGIDCYRENEGDSSKLNDESQFPEDKKLSIGLAREIMADELTV